ncbi:MAG: hypothetical protein FGM32_06725 [Candidatus Kapabacteria bacterium]|nr:hypothetical protein [Candidatus Kapabacteria bacterium]
MKKKRNRTADVAGPAAEPTSDSNRLLRWLVPTIIVVLTAVAYLPVFDSAKEFTNWDDETYVVRQPLVQSLDGANIKKMFDTESRVAANYHPLTMLSLAVDTKRGNGSMAAYMQTTLALHLLNTVLVFVLIMGLSRGNLVMAALCSALFGLHPMHVESVAWVAERKDVLYTALFLGSLISYLRYVRGGSLAWLAAAFAWFVASCFAKPMAVTLPVVLVLIDLWEHRRFSGRSALEKLPFFVVSVIFGLLTLKVQSSESGGLVDTTYFTLGERILFAGYGVMQYCIKLFVPINLSAFYPYPSTNGNPESIVYAYAAVVFAALGAVIWLYIKRRNEFTEVLFFGTAFFLVTISIVLQFISVGGAVIADRYTYVPYLGFFMILGALLDRATGRRKAPYPALAVIGVISIGMGLISTARAEVWQNSGRLWDDVIAQFGNRSINHAYNNRAVYNMDRKNYAKAEQDYAFLESIGTDKSYTYKGYGKLLINMRRTEEAIPRLTKALQLGGPDIQVIMARASCYSAAGKIDSAIMDYTMARSMTQNEVGVSIMLLGELFRANRYNEALELGSSMASAAANNTQYLLLMGVINGQLGNHAQARQYFQRTLELEPNNEQARRNLEIANAAGK